AARTTAWRRAMASLSERNAASLSAASVQRLYGDALRTSVSRLETFASCPFQHFLRYGLDLRERAVADLLPGDIGSVHHAILDDFVGAPPAPPPPLG
ncbi:MAG: PD-(D/E)XK nuclease family protein, partial [Phycisphaerae bacterium]